MGNKLKFTMLDLEDAYCIDLDPISDNRGIFERIYCKEQLKSILFTKEIVQINHSYTKNKGSFRGFHFQNPPFCETKIITCIKGKIFDIIIDVRNKSKTFLEHTFLELSEQNKKMIFIPEGFAHGFQTLSDNCELIYLHTEFYAPKSEHGLNYSDPKLKIKLPLQISEISEKDKSYSFISDNFKGV